MGKKGEAGAFFAGFLIGGLAGAATALLLAPQSGEETRHQIRDKSIEIKEKAEVTYADMQKKVEEATADLKVKVEELQVKVEEAVSEGKKRFGPKTELEEAFDKVGDAIENVEDAVDEAAEESSEA